MKKAAPAGLSPHAATDLIFVLFVSGVVGARFFYIWQHFEDYQGNAWKVFQIQEGGLVWYGGFMTAAVCGVAYATVRKWPVLAFCDYFAPILPLAHAIGRWGCFMNGCCYGRGTEWPIGVRFPGDSVSRHPVQFYESALLLMLSGSLFYLSSKKHKEGELFVTYLLCYSVIRFFLEFFRGDQTLLLIFPRPLCLSLLLFAGGFFLFFFLKTKNDRKHANP